MVIKCEDVSFGLVDSHVCEKYASPLPSSWCVFPEDFERQWKCHLFVFQLLRTTSVKRPSRPTQRPCGGAISPSRLLARHLVQLLDLGSARCNGRTSSKASARPMLFCGFEGPSLGCCFEHNEAKAGVGLNHLQAYLGHGTGKWFNLKCLQYGSIRGTQKVLRSTSS